MINFLEETLEELKSCGKDPNDVSWVGSKDGEFAIDWNKFYELANFEYSAGFGAQEIVSDLVVVFNDNSWLERQEYDGSEAWEYQTPPQKQPNSKPFTNLGGQGHMWDSIKQLNKDG